MRDHWWAMCANQNLPSSIYEKLDSLGNKVDEIKSFLVPFLENQIKEIKTAETIDGLSTSFSAIASGTSSDIHVNCPKCSQPMKYIGGVDYHCERCDGPLVRIQNL